MDRSDSTGDSSSGQLLSGRTAGQCTTFRFRLLQHLQAEIQVRPRMCGGKSGTQPGGPLWNDRMRDALDIHAASLTSRGHGPSLPIIATNDRENCRCAAEEIEPCCAKLRPEVIDIFVQ